MIGALRQPRRQQHRQVCSIQPNFSFVRLFRKWYSKLQANIVLQPSHAVSCEGRLPVGYGRMLGTAKETAENSSDSFSTI